ncbi:MAG: hypothetical protein LBI67_12035 [Treponema sp.]|jgi:hypothetical protein|nr:hypothetical protein [Treponema sp.]
MKFQFHGGSVNKKTPKDLQRLFRRIFLTAEGQEVLRVLLNDWCFFDICKTDSQRTLNEYAKVFIQDRLGIAHINIYADLDEQFKSEINRED